MGNVILGEFSAGYSGWSVSMSDAKTVAVGEIHNKVNDKLDLAGSVKVYRWDSTIWKQKGKDIDGEKAEDKLGAAINMPDANTIAVGAPATWADGYIRVYKWTGKDWIQKGQDIKGRNSLSRVGWEFIMPDSNTIVVRGHERKGLELHSYVQVYIWNGKIWIQKGNSFENYCTENGAYSSSVAMPDSNTLAIVYYDFSYRDSVLVHTKIFTWNGVEWNLNATIKADEVSIFPLFISMPNSRTIAISSYFCTSATGKPGAGKVNIYNYINGIWTKTAALKNNLENEIFFGSNICMPDSQTIAIISLIDSNGTQTKNRLRIFKYQNSNWTQSCKSIDIEIVSINEGRPLFMPDKNTVAIGQFSSYENRGSTQVYNVNCSENHNTVETNECKIYYPNSFTPNMDGRNDLYNLVSNCEFDFYKMTIYNIWGEKLFETTNSKLGWNGEFNKLQTPSGRYVAVFDLIKSSTNNKITHSLMIYK